MKLKACFRGHKPDLLPFQHGDKEMHVVGCVHCGANTSANTSKGNAIAEWNDDEALFWRRPTVEPAARTLQSLRLREQNAREVQVSSDDSVKIARRGD